MAGRVQAQAHALQIDRLAPGQRLQVDVAQARAQQARAFGAAQVVAVAGARMVGMGMGDDGALDRPPRVDVEVARRAVQALRPQLDQVVGHRRIVRRAGMEYWLREKPP